MNIHENKILKLLALEIKEHTKTLSLIGLLFFLCSVVFGIFWIINSDSNVFEPIIFISGICSTIFFGLPQLAEFILPSRKPIEHMTYDELIDFISKTNVLNDWQSADRGSIEERFLKEDPRLRISVKLTDDGVHNDNFQEEWANSNPDPSAISYYYDIFSNGNFIKQIILVSVDGCRATLPLPNKETMKVNLFDYRIAQLFDRTNTLDDYMQRLGLHL